MALTFRQAVVRFLSEPAGYLCDLPEPVDGSRPSMTSVVTLTPGIRFSSAARQIVFSHRDDPASDEGLEWVGDTERGGLTVSLFRSDERPPFVVAYWRLGEGRYLSTFVPARDPLELDSRNAPDLDGLQTVVDNVAVGSACGLPMVALAGPLRHGDLREPEQRDETNFFPAPDAGRSWPVVTFRREPPWAVESGSVHDRGAGAEAAAGSWTEVWVVTPQSVRISCHGPLEVAGELREAVERMRASLTPYAG